MARYDLSILFSLPHQPPRWTKFLFLGPEILASYPVVDQYEIGAPGPVSWGASVPIGSSALRCIVRRFVPGTIRLLRPEGCRTPTALHLHRIRFGHRACRSIILGRIPHPPPFAFRHGCSKLLYVRSCIAIHPLSPSSNGQIELDDSWRGGPAWRLNDRLP